MWWRKDANYMSQWLLDKRLAAIKLSKQSINIW
jgi:hypothetical protein